MSQNNLHQDLQTTTHYKRNIGLVLGLLFIFVSIGFYFTYKTKTPTTDVSNTQQTHAPDL